jgi:hypothetical protein
MKSLYFIIVLAFFCSCRKFVEVDAPINKIIASWVFEDDATATSAILGMYARLVTSSPTFSNGATTIYLSTAADDLNYTGNTADMTGFYNNAINSGNFILYRDFWRTPYETIYHANICIESLQNSTAITTTLKTQLLGESYFIRAFCYYYLVNLFGDVPLLKGTDFGLNAQAPRTSTDEVVNFIIDDLKLARSMLTQAYPSNGRLRVNYFTATALLNRVYLQQQNWSLVEQTANEILDSKIYSLEADLAKTFLANSNETLWQLAFPDNNTFNTIEANRFVPTATATVVPTFTLTTDLYNAFENGDQRKVSWLGAKTIAGKLYYYPFKYKIRGAVAKTEQCIIFRLPEIYLNRAEARAHMNNLLGALSDLNEVRHRANPAWSPFSSSNLALVQQAIMKEKRIEYFAEWGHRWFDLRRTGRLNDILSALKPTWKPAASLFPIPAAEILVNQNLTQNPGY